MLFFFFFFFESLLEVSSLPPGNGHNFQSYNIASRIQVTKSKRRRRRRRQKKRLSLDDDPLD